MTEWKAAEVTKAAMARAFEAFHLESVGYPLVICYRLLLRMANL